MGVPVEHNLGVHPAKEKLLQVLSLMQHPSSHCLHLLQNLGSRLLHSCPFLLPNQSPPPLRLTPAGKQRYMSPGQGSASHTRSTTYSLLESCPKGRKWNYIDSTPSGLKSTEICGLCSSPSPLPHVRIFIHW